MESDAQGAVVREVFTGPQKRVLKEEGELSDQRKSEAIPHRGAALSKGEEGAQVAGSGDSEWAGQLGKAVECCREEGAMRLERWHGPGYRRWWPWDQGL